MCNLAVFRWQIECLELMFSMSQSKLVDWLLSICYSTAWNISFVSNSLDHSTRLRKQSQISLALYCFMPKSLTVDSSTTVPRTPLG